MTDEEFYAWLADSTDAETQTAVDEINQVQAGGRTYGEQIGDAGAHGTQTDQEIQDYIDAQDAAATRAQEADPTQNNPDPLSSAGAHNAPISESEGAGFWNGVAKFGNDLLHGLANIKISGGIPIGAGPFVPVLLIGAAALALS